MRLSASFVPLWIVSVRGANPYVLGAMGIAGMVVSILLKILAGRLADKIGRKKAFYLFHPFTHLGTLLRARIKKYGNLMVILNLELFISN